MKKFSFLAALLISGAVYAITTVSSAFSSEPNMATATTDGESVELKMYPLRGALATLDDIKDGAEILLANANSTYYWADGSKDHENTFLTSLHGKQRPGYSEFGLNVLEGLSLDNVFVVEKTADQTWTREGEAHTAESFIFKHYATGGYLAATPSTERGTDSHIDENKAKATPFAIEHIGMPLVNDAGNYVSGQPGVGGGMHCRTEWTIRLAYYTDDKTYHFGPFWNYQVAEFTDWGDMGCWNVYLVKWDNSALTNLKYRVAELVAEASEFKAGEIVGRYPQEMMDAFKAAVADCEAAIEEEAGDDAYIAKLTALEAAYQALVDSKIIGMEPIFKPGKQIAWDELKAGDKFILQIGLFYSSANLNGSLENYLQASMATNGGGGYGNWGGKGLLVSGNLDETCVFTLEEAPSQINADGEEVDAFYLKNVETGLYVGLDPNNPTALGTGDALWAAYVESTEDALSVTPFGSEGKFGGVTGTGGVNVSDASVRFKHFWTIEGGEGEDDTIWSANFGTVWSYGYASWRNDYDSFIWNAYELALDETWYGQLELKYKQIGGVTFAAGEDPGCFPEDLVTAYEDVCYEAEDALADDLDDDEYKALTAKLQAAYDAVVVAKKELTDGYYYVKSTYSSFAQYFEGRMAWRTPENNFLYWEEFDETNPTYVFKFEKQDDDTWSIQNFTYGNYVGRNVGDEIVMNDELVDTHIVESNGLDGRWHIRYNGNEKKLWYYTDAFAYGKRNKGHVGNNSNSYDAGTYNWNLVRVPEDMMAQYAASAEQVRCIGRLNALLEDALIVYNKAFSYDADKENPLIVDFGEMYEDNTVRLGQISTIFSYSENTYPIALGDGDYSTYFRPAPTDNTPGDFTSMDVDLGERPTQTFIMNYYKRPAYPGEAPTNVSIWARNSEDEDWVKVSRVILNDNNTVLNVTSNGIDMGQPYRYIRFKVEDTAGGNRSWGYGYFSLAEFQLYPAVLNETASQYSYVEGMKDAADKLAVLMNEGRMAVANNNATDAQYDALSAAVDALAELIADPTDLEVELTEAYEYVEKFGAGEEYGQVSEEVYNKVKAALEEAEAFDPEHLDKADLAERQAKTAAALAEFKAAQRKVELDTWMYISCTDTMRAAAGSTLVFGHRIYATGTSVGDAYTEAGDALRRGLYDDDLGMTIDGGNELLSSMWRLVNCGDTAVAFQNRGSLMYMARQVSTSVGNGLSETPVPFIYNFLAPGQVEIICDVPANASHTLSLSAPNANVVKCWNDHRACSPNSWTFIPVDEDALEAATIMVDNNTLTVLTLPFTSESLVDANSASAIFYRISAMPDVNTVELTPATGAIRAGEPVILMTGDPEADPEDIAEEDPTIMLYTEIPTEDAYSLEGKTVNGLVGTVLGEVINKAGMGILRANNLVATDGNKTIIRGGKGYINPNLVTTIEGAEEGMTLTTEGTLDAIKAIVSATKGNNNGNVYTIDGQLVRKSAETKGLPKGIYVVGGKKIIIK